MRIVLKTDPKELAEAVREYGVNAPIEHDALAMHAMQMAIEEFSNFDRDEWYPDGAARHINERAAANLARLMGEGNGNG